LSAVTGPCTAGWFCNQGSTNATQNACTVSNFCIVGSSTPSPCTAGRYCNSTGLSAAAGSGPCIPGYYCNAGSSVSNQNACPVATYCPLGSSVSTTCTAGYYCSTTGLSLVTGKSPFFICACVIGYGNIIFLGFFRSLFAVLLLYVGLCNSEPNELHSWKLLCQHWTFSSIR
jgi:hypothetical protein